MIREYILEHYRLICIACAVFSLFLFIFLVYEYRFVQAEANSCVADPVYYLETRANHNTGKAWSCGCNEAENYGLQWEYNGTSLVPIGKNS